jgi:hypothetical protein
MIGSNRVASCLLVTTFSQLSGTKQTCKLQLYSVTMASNVKLDLSMLIARQGHLAKVAFAAEVSVVAAQPCAVGTPNLTVALEAVNTPSQDGPQAADKHSKRRGRAGRSALDIAKNLLR